MTHTFDALIPPPVSYDREVMERSRSMTFKSRSSFDAVMAAMDEHGHIGRFEADRGELVNGMIEIDRGTL